VPYDQGHYGLNIGTTSWFASGTTTKRDHEGKGISWRSQVFLGSHIIKYLAFD